MTEPLFDYSDKSTEWVTRLLKQYRDAVISTPNVTLYATIVASCESELLKRGIVV